MAGWEHMNWGWGGMLFQLLFWIIIVIAIIWAIKYFIGYSRRGESTPAGESSLELLKKRYARGEINREEFEQKKKDLLA